VSPLEQSVSPADDAPTRGSLVGLDVRGIGYVVRIVAAPRGDGSVVQVTVFAEFEVGLFALHHRMREVVEAALRPSR